MGPSCTLMAVLVEPSAGGLFCDVRIRLYLLFLALILLLFSAQRLVVFAVFRERFRNLHAREVRKAFRVGLRYDLVMALILSLPLLFLLLPAWPSLIARTLYRNILVAYTTFAVTFTFFLLVVDYYFFREFDHRLDDKAVDYLGSKYVLRMIRKDYPLLSVCAATIMVGAGAACFFMELGFCAGPAFSLWRAVTWPFLVVPLVVLGIRGSLGPKSINTSEAYFSDSMTLSQLALNGLFNLREAMDWKFYHRGRVAGCIPLLSEDEVFRTVRGIVEAPGDRFIDDPENPLRRTTDTGRPERPYNVVVVILESLSWHYLGALGGRPGLTPNLDRLAAEGVLADRCFAVGSRTPHGFSGIVCGFPDLPGMSVTLRSGSEGRFLTLGRILERRGYERIFVYGGEPGYDHRRAFLRSNGFNRFVFRGDFEVRTYATHLGWCDGDLFEQAHRTFQAMEGRPFLSVLLTLSFHRPYKIPEGMCEPVITERGRDAPLSCVRYTDWAVGRFMARARRAPYFDRTLFVFVADHTGGETGMPISPAGYRVPFILYGPGVLGPEMEGLRVSSVCSQTDVAPTILHVLGGAYEHGFFGSSVLGRPLDRGGAAMQHSSKAVAWMDGDGDGVIIPCGAGPRLHRYRYPDAFVPVEGGGEAAMHRCWALARRAVAVFQAAEILYERDACNVPGPAETVTKHRSGLYSAADP